MSTKWKRNKTDLSHNQNPVLQWLTQNHASRIKKADIRSYLWQGDCPVLTFIYPGLGLLSHPKGGGFGAGGFGAGGFGAGGFGEFRGGGGEGALFLVWGGKVWGFQAWTSFAPEAQWRVLGLGEGGGEKFCPN